MFTIAAAHSLKYTIYTQEAHVPHSSTGILLESMNTIAQNYDHTVTLIKREQKSISLFENSPLFVNLVSPSHKDTLGQVWLKQWPSILEKKTFKFFQKYFHYFVFIFHFCRLLFIVMK